MYMCVDGSLSEFSRIDQRVVLIVVVPIIIDIIVIVVAVIIVVTVVVHHGWGCYRVCRY